MAGIESLLVGRVLGGRYKIEEVIGRGGMGAVYRATDERLGRQIALKVITVAGVGAGDQESRERLRARFFREARSAAALPHHPNVVPVYDYGSDEALGLDFLVMELLRGSDLASRLARSGPPPLPAALRILTEAAHGLAVGHRQGLIHRDIKPGNIFLTRTHANDVQVRVVDFGIAKVADDEDTLAQLTQDGRVPHSPAYASPEQLRGLSHLTPSADVFSLGAVGFQLLTGDRPFTESDRNKMSLGLAVEAPSVRERNPAVPASVDAIVRKALSFDPKDRYPDAGAMAAELEGAVRAIGETTLDPYLGGAPIISAIDDAGGGGSGVPGDGDGAQPVAGDDDHTQLAPFSDDHTLIAPPPVETAAAAPIEVVTDRERRPIPPRPPLKHQKDGVGGVVVWGLVLIVLLAAGVWGWQALQGGVVAIEETLPDTVVAEPDPAADSLAALVAEAIRLNNEGFRLYNLGQYEQAVPLFEQAVQMFPDSAIYRRNYGYSLFLIGEEADALIQLQRALELDPELALTYANLGQVRLALGDTAAAVRYYEEFIERETDPANRENVRAILREIEVAQNPDLPLLGDPIPTPVPGDPRVPNDTGATPTPALPGGP